MRKNHLEYIILGLLWATAYFATLSIIKTLGVFKVANDTLTYPLTFGTIINMAIFYIVAFSIIPEYSKNKNSRLTLFKTSVFIAGITIFESIIDYTFFVNYYSESEEGFSGQMIINFIINIFFFLTALSYGFIRIYLKNEKIRHQLKQEKLSAEISFLKAQVNPHFLFNVLNMAYSSSTRHGDEQTAEIIEKLSHMMRYMLYESNEAHVPLHKEIDYLKNFVDLQSKRLSDEVKPNIHFNIRGDFEQYKIAPLLLIPFVENAFKHGVRLEQESKIFIDLEVKKDRLNFYVENSVAKKHNNLVKNQGGVGLSNVRKRLELIYPEKYQLHIHHHDEVFKTSLCFPLNHVDHEMYSYR